MSHIETRRDDPRLAPRAAFRGAIHCAWLAPSGGNTPPGVFRMHGDEIIELRADGGRSVASADAQSRESVIGCGAALLHLRVALHAAGHAGRVVVSPDPADADLLARVHLDGAHIPSTADRALAGAILRRPADGIARDAGGIAPHVLSLLLGAARMEGAWLGFVDAPTLRQALADLAAHATPAPSEDATATRAWRVWVERAPTIAVLMTRGDAPDDWLAAGRALARVRLTAEAAGVSVSYHCGPIATPASRPRVAALVREAADPGMPGRRGGMPSDAVPQLVLRVDNAAMTVPDPHGDPAGDRPAGERVA